jgi:hypothetical protein
MNRLAGVVCETLSSGRLLAMLGFLWMVAIWSSIYFMSPGTDDAHFILEALGFMTHGDIGFLYIQAFHEFFLTLPPYAVLHGLFYLAWDGLGLPINYYTYKIFHLLALNALIAASALFIYSNPAASRAVKISRTCLMLVLLGVTPFTLDIFNPRPETLGLACTVLALSFFARANGAMGSAAWGYPAAGFCLGLAAAAHPSFAVTSAGMALFTVILVFRNAAPKQALTAIALGLLPALVIVVWYAAHLPVSLETLSANVGGRSPTASSFGVTILTVVDYIFLRLPLAASFAAKVYWGVPFWTFCLLLLASLAILIGDLRRRATGPLAQLHLLLWVFLAMSLVNVLIASSGRVQIYVVASYAAALLIASRFCGQAGMMAADRTTA